jgi:hypothetical protein
MPGLLLRGMLVGIIAAAVAFDFAKIFSKPRVRGPGGSR